MPRRFTKHARKRLRSRNIGKGSAKSSTYGAAKSLGRGKYKATKGGVTTVYKKKGRKRVVITSWRERKSGPPKGPR